MTIYTYCSYKGSGKGYQYINYNKKDSEVQEKIYGKVRDRFENKDGWFLMLSREGTEGGVLAVSSLERILNYENRRRLKRQKEIQDANNYRKEKLPYDIPELQRIDTTWYLNFAIYDDIEKLYKTALGIINELKKDNGMEFYTELTECFSKSDDRLSYTFDVNKLRGILEKLENSIELIPSPDKSSEVVETAERTENSQSENKDFFRHINFRHIKNEIFKRADKQIKDESNPDVFRRSTDKKTNLDLTLYNPKEFSERNMIVIMENDDLYRFGKFKIALNFDWIMG